MKRVIVIDMAGEDGGQEAVRVEASPAERREKELYAPAVGLSLETVVSEERSFETQVFYKTLFDEYFKR